MEKFRQTRTYFVLRRLLRWWAMFTCASMVAVLFDSNETVMFVVWLFLILYFRRLFVYRDRGMKLDWNPFHMFRDVGPVPDRNGGTAGNSDGAVYVAENILDRH